MLPLDEYRAMRHRPPGRPVMYQRWRDLLFLHFSVAPAALQDLVPKGLTIDTYPDSEGNEHAWVGLIPFRMEGIRPRGLPSLPWLSAFEETNVRTYVHREGKEPGVWFFTLDAARWMACRIARRSHHLPYLHAIMECMREGNRVVYASKRKDGTSEVRNFRTSELVSVRSPGLKLEAQIGPAMPIAEPGSLEFFLIERYLLYAEHKSRLFTGRVFHRPYGLRQASLTSCSQNLVQAVGIECREWEHICFSHGVDVEVFPLKGTP